MKFLIFEDNGGDYRWTLVAASGERLAQSKRFASHKKATRAARIARAGTPSAPIEDGATAPRIADHRLKPRRHSMDNAHIDQRKPRLKKAAGSLTGDKRRDDEGRRGQAKGPAKKTVQKVVDTLPGRGTE